MISKLVIISNESIFKNGDGFYCDNIDSKSIPEGLNKNFDVLVIGKKFAMKKQKYARLYLLDLTQREKRKQEYLFHCPNQWQMEKLQK